MLYSINNIVDFQTAFPELSAYLKVKESLNRLFDSLQLCFSLEVLTGELASFRSRKTGEFYKARLKYGDRVIFLKPARLVNGCVTMKSYESNMEKFVDIDEESCGSATIDGVEYELYNAIYEVVEDIDWIDIARAVGKLIKEDIVSLTPCSRCGGSGFLPQYAYYANGICFECLGLGIGYNVAIKDNVAIKEY